MTVGGYLGLVSSLYLFSILVFGLFSVVLYKYSKEPIKQKSKTKPRILKNGQSRY